MAILQTPHRLPGQESIVEMSVDDSLSAVSAANYVDSLVKQGFTFNPTDEIHLHYGTNATSFGIFIPSISNGIVTLVPWVNSAGGVTLPVTDGNFAIFDGTTGKIKNGTTPGTAATKAASDNTKTSVASIDSSTVGNNVSIFSDVSGTIKDSGITTLMSEDLNPLPALALLYLRIIPAEGDVDITVTQKIKIYGFRVINLVAQGAGNTVQLKKGTTAITEAISVEGAINLIFDATTIDSGESTLNPSDTLKITAVNGGTGFQVCEGFIFYSLF